MASVDRRQFLKQLTCAAGGFATVPAILSAKTLGLGSAVPPSDRITMGCIGTGNQGTNDMRGFLEDERVQVVAVCDVNRESPGYWDGKVAGREPARRIVEAQYGDQETSGTYTGCDTYVDFREILARDDIDAVLIALPDHWHAIPVIEAARAGKDIYAEKPLSLTIAQGRAMSDAVRANNRVFQTGSQQRSDYNFRRVCELVRNDRIGTLRTVRCGLPGGTPDYGQTGDQTDPVPVPDGFDYNRWLGPAPWAPYAPARCFVNFRWNFDYSGGQLTDWGGHHPDIAQWGMNTEQTGPVKITNARGVQAEHPIWNTFTEYYFEADYANGVRLIISNKERGGVTFEGTNGWAWATRGRHDASPKSLLNSVIGPDEVHLYRSDNHYRNFIDSVISRRDPIAPVEIAHRSISIAHLGNIAMRLGRDIHWDPDAEQILGDAEASRYLDRSMRSPWHL